uniref:T-box transcription factor 21 n=2 Tax=Cyprinus carpio TaxID=7962 RepID=A0A8C2I8S3_CYPCA
MGGIGRNLFLNMLNGTDAQSFAKDAELNSHLHRNRDFPDFKMGIQDTRFYYQDSIPNGQDSLTLPFHAEHHQSAGAQTGRFYAPAQLGSCHFTSRSGTGHTYVPGGADAYSSANGKDVYPSSADGYPASFQHGFPRAPMYALPNLQVSGKTHVLLNNYPLWAKFHKYQTEMIITKQGRRMFPFLSFNISSLDPTAHYNIYVDVVLADQHHWRYQGGKWVQCGKAEGNMPGNRMYMHQDSPNTGNHWMRQEVSFGKLKLTNNKGSSNNVAQITQLKIDHNPFAKGFRDNYDTLYALPDSDRFTPSPNESQQLLPGSCFSHQAYLSDQYMSPLPQSRFYSREPVSMTQQSPKDPAASPHSRFYLPSQQGVPPNRLDFNAYESEYTSNSLYKPFPIQTSPHHPLGYYSENPFASGPVSGANTGAWSSGRPSPQYLNHPHHSKPGSSLGWFRTLSSPAASSSPSAVNSRFHSSPLLLDPQRQPLLQDKSKESGEDAWIEAPSVKSVDSADSGLFEGGENKKRRVSPYTSSTENSPPNRSTEVCEKDSCSDAGYYGFYTH